MSFSAVGFGKQVIIETITAKNGTTNEEMIAAVKAEFPKSARNYTWAELMKRVWSLDVLHCDRCGGRMRIVCDNHPPRAVHSVLECLGLPTRAPPIAAAASDMDEPSIDLAESIVCNC